MYLTRVTKHKCVLGKSATFITDDHSSNFLPPSSTSTSTSCHQVILVRKHGLFRAMYLAGLLVSHINQLFLHNSDEAVSVPEPVTSDVVASVSSCMSLWRVAVAVLNRQTGPAD
jgi:hypothetical protein